MGQNFNRLTGGGRGAGGSELVPPKSGMICICIMYKCMYIYVCIMYACMYVGKYVCMCTQCMYVCIMYVCTYYVF